KGSDRISKSQLENGITKANGEKLDGGTGLSRRAIRLIVQSLVTKNILLKRTHRSAAKGDESTEYALNIIGHNPWVPSTPGGGNQSTPGEGREVPTQDTVDKKQTHTHVVSSSQKGKTLTSAHELALYFHRKAGHTAARTPTPKELSHAARLLAAHG